MPTLQAHEEIEKGKGMKVTIPSFQAQSLVHPKIVFGHDRDLNILSGKREGREKERGL